MENTLWNKDKNYRITVYICSIVIVCALIFAGYYSYQSKKRIERRQTEISMKQTVAEALIEKKEAVQKEKEFYAERRKRIESGTANIEVIKGTHMHGSTYEYTLIDGKQEGAGYSWYPNGRKKSESFYRDNLQEGEQIDYYNNEANSIKSRGTYTKGSNIGEGHTWYEDGMLESVSFSSIKDPRLSWSKAWHKNGQLQGHRYFDEEEQLIISLFFYEDGKNKMIFREKLSGRQEGLTESWYESGQKKSESLYQHGRPVYSKEWNEKGELIRQYPESKE